MMIRSKTEVLRGNQLHYYYIHQESHMKSGLNWRLCNGEPNI
jgi:hypothetical protein